MTDVVCFGEVLWDVLPDGALPGGAPMNVAYHLNRLGVKAQMISKVGEDDWGRQLLNFMQHHQIATTLVQQDDNYPTGTVLATPGANHEMQYDIVKPVAYDFIDATAAAIDAVTAASYFVFGSLANRTEHTRNSLLQLLNIAKTKVLDINLRPPHFEQEVLESLLHQADILKINEHELEQISDWHADISLFEDQVKLIADRYGVHNIIITKGAAGASFFGNGKFYHHPGYKVVVADTVGSGDSFLAGFLSSFIKGVEVEQCLDFACKLGAFVATKKGACPEYSVVDGDIIAKAI